MSAALILLVEDHAGFANALRNMLNQNPSFQIAAVAETAGEALSYLRETPVDLVLVDYSLPDMSGVALVEALRAQWPAVPCAILSGHLSRQHARRALEVGARGYLIKDYPLEILEGIPRILNGEIFLSQDLRNSGTNDLLADFR